MTTPLKPWVRPRTRSAPASPPSLPGARAGGGGNRPGRGGLGMKGAARPRARLGPPPASHTAPRQEGGAAASGTSPATPGVRGVGLLAA